MGNKKKIIVGLSLGLFGLFILFNVRYCVIAGIADASTLKSRDELSAYQVKGKLPPPLVWNELQHKLLFVSSEVPEATQYADALGYLFATRGVFFAKFPEIAKPNFELALKNYRQAIENRPMTSVIWADLALVTYYIAPEKNEEIDLLLKNASRFGSSDYSTQVSIAYLQLLRWEHLSSLQRDQLKITFSMSKEPLRTKLQDMARQFNKSQVD